MQGRLSGGQAAILILLPIALTLVLSRVGHVLDATQDAAANCDDDNPQSFREWAAKDFDTWQAAALGMTAFGIAEHGM